MKDQKKIKKRLRLVLGCLCLGLLFGCSEGGGRGPFTGPNYPTSHAGPWYSPLSGTWVWSQIFCSEGSNSHSENAERELNLGLKRFFKRILEPSSFDSQVGSLLFSKETTLSFAGVKGDPKTHQLYVNVAPKAAACSSLEFPLFYHEYHEGLLPRKKDGTSFYQDEELTRYYESFSPSENLDFLTFDLGVDPSLCTSGHVFLDLKRHKGASPKTDAQTDPQEEDDGDRHLGTLKLHLGRIESLAYDAEVNLMNSREALNKLLTCSSRILVVAQTYFLIVEQRYQSIENLRNQASQAWGDFVQAEKKLKAFLEARKAATGPGSLDAADSEKERKAVSFKQVAQRSYNRVREIKLEMDDVLESAKAAFHRKSDSSGRSGFNGSSAFVSDSELKEACKVLELDFREYFNASSDERKKLVEKSWKRLSRIYHPDKSQDLQATEKTQQINAAKDLLLPKPTQSDEPPEPSNEP